MKGRGDPTELQKLRGRAQKVEDDLDAGLIDKTASDAKVHQLNGDLKNLKKMLSFWERRARERKRLLDEGIGRAKKRPLDPADKAWLDADRRRKELASRAQVSRPA